MVRIAMELNEGAVLPFHTYLLKIASRCNLDCTYCYVYNSVDAAWRDQPKFMSSRTARTAVQRIREHLLAHGKKEAMIVFHGGEPLMGGLRHISELLGIIRQEFAGTGIKATVGLQSNLLLFDDEIGRFLTANGMSIGVSVDGPPRINDRYRVDRLGRPTSQRLEERLRLLTERYHEAFGGFLSVIDLEVDPIEVIDYLTQWRPPAIDFLLPLNNHARKPVGKQSADHPDAPYGDWLIRAFDRWTQLPDPPIVRTFQSIIQMLCGGQSTVESLGLLPVDLIVVEADGSLEAVDSLRTTYEGATRLGFDVFRNSFDEAAAHVAVRARQAGAASLAETCRKCEVVRICGGGYLPHRWSIERGFDNPSVYCADLKKIIFHIHRILREHSAPLRSAEV